MRRLVPVLALLFVSLAHAEDERPVNEASLELAALRNTCSCLQDDDFYLGPGLRYGRRIREGIFLDGDTFRDTVAAELAAYFYQIENFVATGDRYSVLPLIVDARYSVALGSVFEPFVDIGVLKNFLISSDQAVSLAQTRLSSAGFALGAGLLCHITPRLGIRAVAGYESFGGGVTYSF